MERSLEPTELVPIGEDDLGHDGAVDLTSLVQDPLAEVLDEGTLHRFVLPQQAVDDLVARDRCRTVPREGGERLGLAGADAAGDRDR